MRAARLCQPVPGRPPVPPVSHPRAVRVIPPAPDSARRSPGEEAAAVPPPPPLPPRPSWAQQSNRPPQLPPRPAGLLSLGGGGPAGTAPRWMGQQPLQPGWLPAAGPVQTAPPQPLPRTRPPGEPRRPTD